MRKIFQYAAVAVILLITATFAFSQQRITFKRGARSAVAAGILNGYRRKKIFLIRVRRGQTLTTEQVKNNSSNRYISVSITAPGGEAVGDSDASCNNRKRISPTRAGDYRIEVYECQKADPWRGSFRLKVRVQ